MSVLVTYATSQGSTRDIAEHIATQLRTHSIDVVLLSIQQARASSCSKYAAVVIGSAVHAGHWLRPAQNYLKSAEPPRHAWAFSVGMADGDDRAREAAMLEKRIKEPWPNLHGHRLFRGRFDEQRAGWFLKLCLAFVPSSVFPRGDARDWGEISDWSHELAGEMKAAGIITRGE
jgi:menaquinone-dependent protoporphyrinogen oxidase